MDATDKFVAYCLALSNQPKNRTPDYSAISESIFKKARTLPGHVHPMITEIMLLAEYIDDWYSENEDDCRVRLEDIHRLTKAYQQNHWLPTVWCFMATYLISHDGKVTAGFSTRVNRIHGRVEIFTGNRTIRDVMTKLAQELDNDQTDEWYIHNLARRLPKNIGYLRLSGVEVSEELKRSTK